MTVYTLTANVYDGGWGVEIVLFGVFRTEEKAEARAKTLELNYYKISKCEIDKSTNQYLGGYIE